MVSYFFLSLSCSFCVSQGRYLSGFRGAVISFSICVAQPVLSRVRDEIGSDSDPFLAGDVGL